LLNNDIVNNYSKNEIVQMPPLALAWIGDAVFEVFVREKLIFEGGRNVKQLHRGAISFVKAEAQCRIVRELDEYFTDEEKAIIRRGRNVAPHTVPKNASITDYRYATGFEALIGYLYFMKEEERLAFIFNKAYEIIRNVKE